MIILSLFFAAVFGELGKRLVDTPADGASETWILFDVVMVNKKMIMIITMKMFMIQSTMLYGLQGWSSD